MCKIWDQNISNKKYEKLNCLIQNEKLNKRVLRLNKITRIQLKATFVWQKGTWVIQKGM